MKTKLLIAILIAAAALPALAETTNSGWFFCLSKEDAKRAAGYLAEGDKEAIRQLEDAKRLFPLKEGLEVSILERSWGLVKFRLKGSIVEFWTVSEAIKR